MKVLIISHNPLSPQGNMGKTLCSLFSEASPESLCQLYIYPTVPQAQRCSSYFRMTDLQALRGMLAGRSPGGEVVQIDAGAGKYETASAEKLYTNRRNASALRGLLRDAMWTRSGWNSKALQQWLEAQAPDVIFMAPGRARFLYDFALQISTQRQLPVVTYLCDEYYFRKPAAGWLARRQQRLLKEKMEALLAATKHLVTISPEMQALYHVRFQVPTTVLMTGATILRADQVKVVAQAACISYFGNIRCNRYRSLAEIGQALDAINAQAHTNYRLKIYTAERDEAILSALKQSRSVEICGFLSGAAFTQALQNAQRLLHVEAFDTESVERVKHSVSTKIADSLASGIPLVAYGPEHVASMAHLRRNDCAILIHSRQELPMRLRMALEDPLTCRRVNGLAAAQKYHDSRAVSEKLWEILYENSADQQCIR